MFPNSIKVCRYCSGHIFIKFIVFVRMTCFIFTFVFNSSIMAAFFLLVFCSILPFIFSSSPKLLQFQSQIYLFENMTFQLSCSLVSGHNISFEWNYNKQKLINNSNIKIESFAKLSSLTFQSVQKEHSGTYECRAINVNGQYDVTKTRINVQGKVLKFEFVFLDSMWRYDN